MTDQKAEIEPGWRPPEAIQQLVDAGCLDLVPELIHSFTSDVASRIQTARAAADQGDITRLQRSIHSVKGSALQMGAGQLASICREIETAGPAAGGYHLRIAELCAAFRETEHAMGDYLSLVGAGAAR